LENFKLSFRTSKEQENERQKNMLQEQCEGELEQRQRHIELRKEFEEKLSVKRQSEAEENKRRLQDSKDDYLLKCQEHLRNLLTEKEYIKDQHLQNIRRFKVWKCLFYFIYNTYIWQDGKIMDIRNLEEKRRVYVEKAMEDLLEKYCKYREELNSQMENKMRRAESLRKERLDNLSRSRSEQMW
jgi:hypothetical protein